MRPPGARAIRLVTGRPGVRPPKPPFGLPAWSAAGDAGDAVGVLLDASQGDLDELAVVAAQIPAADTLAQGTPVFILEVAAHTGPMWQRLFSRPPRATRTVRCTALLVRGYVDIGADRDPATDAVLAWGIAP